MARKKTVETPEMLRERMRYAVLIRTGRAALGLSQREFGSVVGLHYSSLARFESGQMRLKSAYITRILAFFEQSGLGITQSEQDGVSISIPRSALDAMINPQITD